MVQRKIPVVGLSELRLRITLPGERPLVLWYGLVGSFGTGLPLGKYQLAMVLFADEQQNAELVMQSRAALPVPISVMATMLLLVRLAPFRVKPTPENP